MSKAAGLKTAKTESAGKKKKPRRTGPAKPASADARAQQTAAPGTVKSVCACGGGCPGCTAGTAQRHDPRAQPSGPRQPDAAEAEARKLAPRLSLIGEPKAAPAPAAAQPGGRPGALPRPPNRDRPALRRTRAPDPRLTRHRRLTLPERGAAESAMEIDLSGVRIHTGAVANSLAAQAGALAFAHGNHIVLSARAERLSGASYARVLSHELIHVVQQSAPPLPASSRYQWPEARGPPVRPLIRTPPQVQCWVVTDAIGGFASDVGSAAYNVGADAVGGVVDFAGDVADVVGDSLRYVVDRVAPGLWSLLTGGALEMLGEWLCKGIDFVLGTLFGGLADVDIMTSLETTFARLAAGITGIKDTIFGQLSNAVGAVLSPFVKAMQWASPLIETAQSLVTGISDVFSSVWDSIAVPALELLETVGGAIWDGFKWLLGKLWGGVKAVRNFAGWAWDELSDLFGIDWGGESDVSDTLAGYASDAFDALKKGYEKIKRPLLAAVAILAVFSPLGPVIILTQVLPPLYDKIKWLIDNWDKAEIVVQARELLHDEIIPGIQSIVGGVKGALAGAAAWLASMLGSIAGAVVRVIAAFGGGGCAKSVDRILANIENQVKRFQAWANGGFQGLNEALGAAFDAISAFFEPIFKFIAALIQVAAAPFTLPLVIVGAVWLLLPEPLKPTVIKFVLDLIILAVSAIPAFLPGLFPLAAVFKSGLLGFLRRLRGDEIGDERRVAASNKVAGIMTGSIPFIAGFSVGILRGLIDGIIDPFKILFMLFDLIMKGVAVVGRAVNTLIALISPDTAARINQVSLAISGPAPAAAAGPGQPQTTGTAPAPQTVGAVGPRAPPQVMDSRLTRGVQPIETSPAANIDAAPATANTNAPPAGAGLVDSAQPVPQNPEPVGNAAPASQGESGEEISFESDVSDEQIIANMPPGVVLQAAGALAGEVEFTPESLEAQMQGEVTSAGSTVRGLASLLGSAWDFLISGAARIGRMAADWFLEFIEQPNYALGNKLGWLTGTILLELLINYFTAGGYMVIQKSATWGTRLLAYFLRYLDMGGAILGIMGKGLAKLRGPVLGGLDVASGFLSRFRFIESILGRVRGAADWLFRFGDEIGLAADIARRGPVDGVAGRAATGLADEGATGLARQVDEALPPAPAVARADDAVPPTPAMRASESATPSGSRRVADDAPAPQRAVDDAAPAPAPAPAPARAADQATQAQGNRAAREAMEGAGNRPPRQGLDEAADGSRRTIDDAATPTLRDDALRATEFPQAILAARQIAEVNDLADMPIPVVMGQLLFLKRRYRWIDYFRARPAGGPGVFRIGMVASPETEVDGHYDTKDRLIQVAPGVVRRPRGTPPGRARGAPPGHARGAADPALPARDVTPDVPATNKRGFDSDEIAEHFDDVTGGNGGMVPTGRSQNARIPDFPGRTERHTNKVMQLDNNASFGGANEGMFNRHLDQGTGAVGARFDRVAEQVHIRPITHIDANGNPVYANYKVIADNVGLDRRTGGLHILDAKTTPSAPLTSNQSRGYPLIAANGGRVESRGLGGPLAHHTDLPPTPVSRATPNVRLSDPNATLPPGGLRYDLEPVPAAPIGRTRFPVNPANPATPPHPSVAPPPSAGVRPTGNAPRGVNETAEQAGERVGRHSLDNAPVIDPKKSVDEVGDGSLRAAQDAAPPTVRNPAAKLAELPEAIAAAKTITTAADLAGLPIEVVLGNLMLLKGRYRWIETFLATPKGTTGRYEIVLIASRYKIDLIEVDSIFLYHGTSQARALGLARNMQAPNPGFQNSAASHDLGPGLYLFDNPRNAQTYAQTGGTIIEIEIPLPHPDEIADIAIRGFGRNGAPGAERAQLLEALPDNVLTGAQRRQFNLPSFSTYGDRDLARVFTNQQSAIPGAAFNRNIARGQLFAGNVPAHSLPAQGGLGFEFDAIQWRIARPTEDIRRQIIAQILGSGGILP